MPYGGLAPRSDGECVCGCHDGDRPRRLPGRWLCAECYDALADGYAGFVETVG